MVSSNRDAHTALCQSTRLRNIVDQFQPVRHAPQRPRYPYQALFMSPPREHSQLNTLTMTSHSHRLPRKARVIEFSRIYQNNHVEDHVRSFCGALERAPARRSRTGRPRPLCMWRKHNECASALPSRENGTRTRACARTYVYAHMHGARGVGFAQLQQYIHEGYYYCEYSPGISSLTKEGSHWSLQHTLLKLEGEDRN